MKLGQVKSIVFMIAWERHSCCLGPNIQHKHPGKHSPQVKRESFTYYTETRNAIFILYLSRQIVPALREIAVIACLQCTHKNANTHVAVLRVSTCNNDMLFPALARVNTNLWHSSLHTYSIRLALNGQFHTCITARMGSSLRDIIFIFRTLQTLS